METKGTILNPYSVKEFETMLEAGTWKGGYVQGLGYCLREASVTASSNSSYSSLSDISDISDFYPSIDPGISDLESCTPNSESPSEPLGGDSNNAPGPNETGLTDGHGSTNGNGGDTSTGGNYVQNESSISNSSPAPSPQMILAERALKYVNYSEKDNPGQIVKWLQAAGCTTTSPTTPWCASFVYAMFKEAGLQGYKCASVRGWKDNWGKFVSVPQVGDVAFYTNGWSHMGIVTQVKNGKASVISGNYSNKVYVDSKDISFFLYKRAK